MPPNDPAEVIPLGRPRLESPPVELLSAFERGSFHLADFLFKRCRPLSEWWLRTISVGWMTWGSRYMMNPVGLERLKGLSRKDGIVLVSNHRSFFDMYMLMLLLYRLTPLDQPVLCPVRARFFYQQWAGMFVNFFVGGGRMFPPFFKETEKADFNKWSLLRVEEELKKGELLVGFFPEGTRNKNEDPYTPLPAQPGVGKLVMDTWPIVVPVFINGLTNNIIMDMYGNYKKTKRVVAVFGEPIDLSPFKKLGNRATSHKKVADALLKRIYQLGEEERVYRAQLEREEAKVG